MNRRFAAGLLLLCCLAFPAAAMAQTANATVSGVVDDASRALIPGVDITLTNTLTGVVQRAITNESGVYNFPSVLPGTYRVTAELPGFRTSILNDVPVGTSAQVRLNFTLQVGDVTQSIEVSVSAQALLTESSASVGDVLPEYRIRDLPLVGNDVLNLIYMMPGIVGDSFAGTDQMQINTVRDGLSVAAGRMNSGLFANTVLNPDLVGEVRVILAPVDAELGRGNAQVQIQTRSGTNDYAGAATWSVRNSGLDANTWANNRNIDSTTGLWSPTPPNWENNHQYVISYGGPILRNRTFFYTVWEQQKNFRRDLVTANVMTGPARQGIFRYYNDWSSGSAESLLNATGANPNWPSVDFSGNPIFPSLTPGGDPYGPEGPGRCISVFGTVKVDGSPFTAADCGAGFTPVLPPGGAAAWDNFRPGFDPTGYISKILAKMPEANYFGAGDGLNVARFRWLRGRQGTTGAGVTHGTSNDTNRKQINIKIDHNFDAANKLSVSWTGQWVPSWTDVPNWPDGISYLTQRKPHILTVNFTSTLSPNLVNEARFGIRYVKEGVDAPWEMESSRDAAMEYILQGGPLPAGRDVHPDGFHANGHYLALANMGAGNFAFGGSGQGVMSMSPGQYNGNRTPLYNFADTISWTTGAHAYKFGVEVRLTATDGYNNIPQMPHPRISGGQGGNASPLSNNTTLLPGSVGNTRTNAANMLYFLAGSVNNVTQLYWIDSEKDFDEKTWQDTATAWRKVRDQRLNEWSAFVKDDWKISRNLTLNLGLRYEYYGAPFLASGFTTTAVDQGAGMFGLSRADSGNLFDNWLLQNWTNPIFFSGYGPNAAAGQALVCNQGVQQAGLPTSTCNPDKLTRIHFVGPKTSNPDISVQPDDRNNFGPAVGFAWQVPWFGQGQTTVRGGYQITFWGAGRNSGGGGNTTDSQLGSAPGALSIANTTPLINQYLASYEYLDLTRVANLVPVIPTSPDLPGEPLEYYRNNTAAFYVFDPNYATPYTQNFTLSLTRNINRYLTTDVRYVGTVSKKQQGTLNINIPNVYYNPELWEALEITRQGGNAPLFDQMFAGLNVAFAGTTNPGNYRPVGTVAPNGVLQTGSMHLRRRFAAALANGNFTSVASSLATLNTVSTHSSSVGAGLGLLPEPAGREVVGRRVLRNGCDRIAAGLTSIPTRCFPENYIQVNPQVGTPTFITNNEESHYHSLQAQLTLRPVAGTSWQGTYTRSVNRGLPATATDPLNRKADYDLLGGHRAHDFRMNGTLELPFGPNQLILGNSTGWLAGLVGGWRTSFIYSWNSGAPTSVAATAMMYGNGVPDLVGAFDLSSVKVRWDEQLGYGTMEGAQRYVQVTDPRCSGFTADAMQWNLGAECTLTALMDSTTGQIVLQHPQSGSRGTLGRNTISLASIWNFDANISKSFNIDETKTLQIRIDTTNVLNNPRPANPSLNLNSDPEASPFGRINTKGNQTRTFQGQVRLTF